MTPAQLAILKTELTTDPLGRYAGLDDAQAAERLNVPDRTTDRDTLHSGELIASIVSAEYTALTANQKDYVRLVAMAESLPITGTLRSELGGIFPAGSQTRGNLVALLRAPGSRARELGLPPVTPSDVADARRLP